MKYILLYLKTIKYIQVCYKLENDETIVREFSAFDEIDEKVEKYVISLGKNDFFIDNVRHINVFDLLMNNGF